MKRHPIPAPIWLIPGLMIAGIISPVHGQTSEDITISISYKNKDYVGKPLAWDGKEMLLLRRDGKLNILPVESEHDYKTVSSDFQPFSRSTLRHQLQKEFGGEYQVSVTEHFVVVHPPGETQTWAQPFEKLYSRFRHYFSSRGVNLDRPEFPMVAVVLKTRTEFDRFLRNNKQYDPQILGYYSPKSNRVITYNQGEGESQGENWFFQINTLIHEATHQTAFNTGLHSRFAPVPRWVSEGLAMMFEAPGVNNSSYFTDRSDRINHSRLADLKRFYEQGQVDGKFAELVSSDEIFRSDPMLAYAMSWGLTFYLSEHRPGEYVQFLQADSRRQDFSEYTSQERLKAFGRAFGYKFNDLEGRMKRFILSL